MNIEQPQTTKTFVDADCRGIFLLSKTDWSAFCCKYQFPRSTYNNALNFIEIYVAANELCIGVGVL